MNNASRMMGLTVFGVFLFRRLTNCAVHTNVTQTHTHTKMHISSFSFISHCVDTTTWPASQLAKLISRFYLCRKQLSYSRFSASPWLRRTSGQRNLTKAAPQDSARTARGVHCTRRRRFKPRDRQTDRQTPRTSVRIVRISCIRGRLKTMYSSLCDLFISCAFCECFTGNRRSWLTSQICMDQGIPRVVAANDTDVTHIY